MRYDIAKAFPYPVLRVGSSDYLDGAFQATVRYSAQDKASTVFIETRFNCSEPSIKKLIEKGEARFAILVESRETFFSDLILTADEKIEKKYSGGLLKGNIAVSPYILSVKDIEKFNSENLNSEFKNGSIYFDEADVLAIDKPREFYVGLEIFINIGTVFELAIPRKGWTMVK